MSENQRLLGPVVPLADREPYSIRLRSANILLITFKALANEVAKNLVLAGIGSLTIIDDAIATEEDLGAQFFLTQDCVGQNVFSRPGIVDCCSPEVC